MKITINDNPIDHSFSDQTPLAQALHTIQSSMISPRDVITTIHINGEELQEGQLTQWQNRPLADFDTINIEIMARALFASSGLRIMAAQLEESESTRNQIVDSIAQGRTETAMQLLSQYLQLWHTVQQSLVSACSLMDADPGALTDQAVPDIPVSEAIDQLSGQLSEIKTTLETGDTVTLGDILDYEFGDITHQWTAMLHQIADRFDQSESPENLEN